MADCYKRVGVFYTENGNAECRVWAPMIEKVDLLLHNTGQPLVQQLEKDEWGYWSAELKNVYPGMRYTFRLDETTTYPDPATLLQPDGVFGASEIADRNFPWTDDHWKGMELGDMIMYELHTGTFTASGDFNGIAGKLDYLQQLGITTIELMPVAQFSGSRNWGYDGVLPFAVQHTYGGMNALKLLVNAAHAKGIAVVLDVVYNHAGPEGSVLQAYGPYFTNKYKTAWGRAINLDDAWSYGVRNYFLQNALMWLDEFHIDGLRVDAVHALYDNSAKHFAAELKEQVLELEKRTGKKKILVAEFDLNTPRNINAVEKGGYGWNGQWVDEFHHALHALVTGETNGYYEDFGLLEHLHKAFTDTYVYTGQYSVHRKKLFGVPVYNPYNQFVVFAQNHDHIGNRMQGERLTSMLSFEQLKLVAATVLLSPYVPLLFMGEEYGEKNPFLFFSGYTDPELVKKVRQGRKDEFGYFGWEGQVPDPFADDTFNRSKLSWNYSGEESSMLLKYYKYLVALRKNSTALQQKERGSMIVHPLVNKLLLSFERVSDKEHLLVVFNFSNGQQQYKAPSGCWKKIMDSSAWHGPAGPCYIPGSSEKTITVNPFTAVVFKQDEV